MQELLSKKFLLGLVSVIGIIFSSKLNLSLQALYILGIVAVISVGGQSVIDALTTWLEGRPFKMESPCAASAPSQHS